jgi:hypothetical protein
MESATLRDHVSISSMIGTPLEMRVLPEVYRENFDTDESSPLKNFLVCLHDLISEDPKNYTVLHSVIAKRMPLSSVAHKNKMSLREVCRKMVKVSGTMGLKKNCVAIRKLLDKIHDLISEDPKNFRILYLRTCERKRFEEMRRDKILYGLSSDTIRRRFDRMADDLPFLRV